MSAKATYWCEALVGGYPCGDPANFKLNNNTCMCGSCLIMLQYQPRRITLPVVPLGQIGQDAVRLESLRRLRRSFREKAII